MGTSELYRSVLALDEVVDALVVDVPQETRAARRMSLFVVLRDGACSTTRFFGEIKRRIREDCSPRHVPDEIVAAPAIPARSRGRSSKCRSSASSPARRRPDVASRDSLAKPEALDWFAEFANR